MRIEREAKPAPGPWGQIGREIVDARGVQIAIAEWRGMGGLCVAEANARLISAAWELLEALKKAVHELNAIRARDGVPYTHQLHKSDVSEEYFSSVVDEGFAVIAKAEGR